MAKTLTAITVLVVSLTFGSMTYVMAEKKNGGGGVPAPAAPASEMKKEEGKKAEGKKAEKKEKKAEKKNGGPGAK